MIEVTLLMIEWQVDLCHGYHTPTFSDGIADEGIFSI
jgi:hypothetical protein